MRASPRPQFDQAFLDALLGEDDLGVVVRAHIHIEASLNEFIEAMIPFPGQLPKLRYQQRVCLACALGLKDEHRPALKFLGEMRNAFAHKPDTSLTAESVTRLYKSLSLTDRDAVAVAYRNTNSQTSDASRPDFLNLAPKDQFVLIAVSLKAMLMVATYDAHRHMRIPKVAF